MFYLTENSDRLISFNLTTAIKGLLLYSVSHWYLGFRHYICRNIHGCLSTLAGLNIDLKGTVHYCMLVTHTHVLLDSLAMQVATVCRHVCLVGKRLVPVAVVV